MFSFHQGQVSYEVDFKIMMCVATPDNTKYATKSYPLKIEGGLIYWQEGCQWYEWKDTKIYHEYALYQLEQEVFNE